jgi:fucose 4-O-acetylase-like acetyltransferase
MGMIGLTLLVWIERVPVPLGVDRLASMVAAASLYIYLTHYEFQTALEKVGVTTPIVVVATALVGGVIVARVADRATAILLAVIPRKAMPARTGTDTTPARADVELLSYR